MSAYNWILSNQKCPNCKNISTIRSQIHIASSYGGDDHGRFHDYEYYLGDTMRWFYSQDNKYEDWKMGNKIENIESKIDMECCYSTCLSCNFKGYSIITVKDLKINSITCIDKLDNWPNDYYE